MDKVFVASAVATLFGQDRLSLVAAFALVLRDIAEIPLALWLAWDASAHHLALASAAANRAGKSVTVLQFTAIAAAVLGVPHVGALAAVTSAAGLFAAGIYLRRALWRETSAVGRDVHR
jgi:phosphatidylglycerophosphate synthase